jgi:hypothetical protein
MDTQISPEKEPRYVLCATGSKTSPANVDKNIWFIEDLQTGFKSELYTATEALALLQWLEERETGYEWTPLKLRGILRS